MYSTTGRAAVGRSPAGGGAGEPADTITSLCFPVGGAVLFFLQLLSNQCPVCMLDMGDKKLDKREVKSSEEGGMERKRADFGEKDGLRRRSTYLKRNAKLITGYKKEGVLVREPMEQNLLQFQNV